MLMARRMHAAGTKSIGIKGMMHSEMRSDGGEGQRKKGWQLQRRSGRQLKKKKKLKKKRERREEGVENVKEESRQTFKF